MIKELYRSSWDGLRSHKLRSGLTALGVIFGVAAVIGMTSIGAGAKREALRQIEQMGAANIIIDVSRGEDGEMLREAVAKNPRGLKVEDARALGDIIGAKANIIPQRIRNVAVRAGRRKVKVNVVASTPALFELQRYTVESGRRFTSLDEGVHKRVCVIGWEAGRELFPLESPLGRDVLVYGQLFTVVGVIGRIAAGGSGIKGLNLRNRNMDLYVPLATSLKRLPPSAGESELDRIILQLIDTSELTGYAELIGQILRRRHHGIEDFKVIVPEELLHQHQETQRIFNIVMGTIASISLIVGGIGIMNIMLASVLERTREIGIRRALGARQGDIARQFMLEAVLLSLLGGVVGVALGLLLAKGISLYAGWETAVSVWAVLVAVTVSAGVGVIFGYLPARRAAKLDPITALRFE